MKFYTIQYNLFQKGKLIESGSTLIELSKPFYSIYPALDAVSNQVVTKHALSLSDVKEISEEEYKHLQTSY
jgi:hypothetical protein